MEASRTSLCTYLSQAVADVLSAISTKEWETVQEVRLRADAPLTLSMSGGERSLALSLSKEDVQECFVRLCERAIHSHQEELKCGFVTTRDGFRVGVAGTAVVRDAEVVSYRDIRSLCVRIPRAINGCANALLPSIDTVNGVKGLLLCGPPASGKTTLLRDIAASLSMHRRVAVVDERFELSSCGLPQCDVLRGCPKAIGMWQAIRTLAPDVVIVDELGCDAQWEAVSACLYAGVAVIASVHAQDERDLAARHCVRRVLTDGGFSQVAFLKPRTFEQPRIREVAELVEAFRNRSCDVRLCGSGVERRASSW